MVDPKKDRGHSRLSPSSAHRWIYCPGSVPFIESLNLPKWSSAAATLGTVVHSLLEMALRSKTSPHKWVGKKISTQEGPTLVVDKGMANAAEVAVEHVAPQFRIAEAYGIEDQLDIPATGEWGTMDAWAITDEVGEWVIDVWDYKNGMHPVEAKKNPQLRLYGDGVWAHIGANLKPAIKLSPRKCKLRLHIIQPNAMRSLEKGIDTWETMVDENFEFMSTYVKPAVKAINAGNAKRIPGAHCKRCPGAARCPELAKAVAKTARMDWADDIR